MPYIDPSRRNEFIDVVNATPETPGELCYLVYRLMLNFVQFNKQNYQAISEAIGALEGAKLEFYRRIVAPYEDKKRAQNGDV